MHFYVPYIRHRGRALPWREVANRPALRGDLHIEECKFDEQRRLVRTARLCSLTNMTSSAVTPELLDAQIIGMSPLAFTLAGFERIDGIEYAQAWLVSDKN